MSMTLAAAPVLAVNVVDHVGFSCLCVAHASRGTSLPASLWRPGGLALGSNGVHHDRLLQICLLQWRVL